MENTGSRSTPRPFVGFWLGFASLGVVIAAVAVVQAKYHERIERGVRGSFLIATCAHAQAGRRVLDSWECGGTFQPNGAAPSRHSTLMTDQKDAPSGEVAVMAARPDDSVVWLPGEVSARRLWTRAGLALAFITLPGLAPVRAWRAQESARGADPLIQSNEDCCAR